MLDQYLIIHKSILPEYYEKVIEARRMLEDGRIAPITNTRISSWSPRSSPAGARRSCP